MSDQRLAASDIKRLRAEANLTQRQLGELLGVTSAAVAHWESGATTPNGDNQRALTRVLIEGSRTPGSLDERTSRLEREVRDLRAAVTVLQELVGRLARE